MASKKLRMLLASGLLAVAAALAGTSGAAFAGAPAGTPGPLTVCDNVNTNVDLCCPPVENGAAPAGIEVCCVPLVTFTVVPANPVICPSASPSETATPTETATETPTATPTQCGTIDVNPDAAVTAAPTMCPTATPFESFQGETATAGQITPPPTTSGSNGSSNNSMPLFALLICLAFGAIGLAAAADQRRTIRR